MTVILDRVRLPPFRTCGFQVGGCERVQVRVDRYEVWIDGHYDLVHDESNTMIRYAELMRRMPRAPYPE